MTVTAQDLPAGPLPVSAARNGFTPEQARSLRDRYSYIEVISAGDVSLFHFLDLNAWLPAAQIAGKGNVVPLRVEPDARFGATRIKGVGPRLNHYLHDDARQQPGV